MQLPWTRAPRAALSSPLTVLVTVVAGLLLSFVVSAAVLHYSSVGSAAISYQEGRNCQQNVGPSLRASRISAGESGQVLDAARLQGQQHGFGGTIGGIYSDNVKVGYHGKYPWARIAYRDQAFDHLTVVQGGGRDGTWIPASIARQTGAKLGDRGTSVDFLGQLPPITAIYADLAAPPTEFWCTEQEEVVMKPLAGDGEGPTIFVPRKEDLSAAFAGEQTMTATVHYQLSPLPGTIGEAADVTERGAQLLDAVQAGGGTPINVQNFFARPVQIAQQSADKVRDSTLPLIGISLVVGLIGLASVAVQWCQRRQAELRLLWSRGAGPLALGARAALELTIPLVLGCGLGLLLAHLLRGQYAPAGALPDGSTLRTVLLSVGIAVLGVATLTLTTAARCHRTLQTGRTDATTTGRIARYLPWELVTALLALLAWLRLANRPGRGGATRALVDTDAAGLAFPLLVVLTVALVVIRLARVGLALSHRIGLWRVPAAHLAMRRLAAAAGSVIGVLVVGILAVGTVTIGTGIADAQDDALSTKSGLLVGAETSVQIPPEVGFDPTRLPPDLAAHGTTVAVVEEPARTFLVVDPATFTSGAWLGDRDAGDVQATLNSLQDGGKHALAVGRAPTGAVTVPGIGQLDSSASTASFPYIGTSRGYVLPRAAVTNLRVLPSWQLWTTLPMDQVVAELDRAGIVHGYGQTRTKALDGLPFLTVTWTFNFVTALGLVLGVVAAVALVLAVEVRRRQNAVSGTLATRMGLRRRTLAASHVLELGSLAALATAAGVVTGLVTTNVSAPLFDPAPWLRPTAAGPDLIPLVLLIALVDCVVVAVVSWTAVRSVRTARIGELIRG